MENDLPAIEVLPTHAPVIVTFYASEAGGTIIFEENTASATCEVVNSLQAKVTSGGPTSIGHVKIKLVDGRGEVARALVTFLGPVSFS